MVSSLNTVNRMECLVFNYPNNDAFKKPEGFCLYLSETVRTTVTLCLCLCA